MVDLSSAKKFQFVGGNLALDFCNTVGGKRGVINREYLNSYFDLAAWSYQAGLLESPQAQALLETAQRDPETAATVLSRAIELRESIFRIFLSIISGNSLPQLDLERLNSELARSLGRMRLRPAKNGKEKGFRWTWAAEERELDHPLGPIAHAAATLLTHPEHLGRVDTCHGDTCGWVFVDLSKNHSRRWCDMRDCGNRAKIRRHRLKQKQHEH